MFAGADAEFVDYKSIDTNAKLDEHWAREIQQDAEEAYFDDMDF